MSHGGQQPVAGPGAARGGRPQASLDGFWSTLTARQTEAIQGIALDMWEPYVQAIRAHLPEANEKIVFDKFHVAKHLGLHGPLSLSSHP